MDKEQETKQEVIDKLKGEFIVTKINKQYTGDELEIKADFLFKDREGRFVYTLIGRERGIDGTELFEEEGDEDVYAEIHDWIDEHIECKVIVKCDGKEI